MKVWFVDLEFFKSKGMSVFVWIKFYNFDIKYWSVFGFSKIGSLVGILMVVDMKIRRKILINFVRIFFEVELGKFLKEKVLFKNEKGIIIE